MKKTKRGFTIVELVIVIAVIAILAAILIPVFANVTESANEASLKTEIRNAYSAFVADAALNGEEYLEIEDYIFYDGETYYAWTVIEADEDADPPVEAFEGWKEAATDPTGNPIAEDYNGFDLYAAG